MPETERPLRSMGMQHRHKNRTAGYNPRRLLSNSCTVLSKSPRILSRLWGFSAQHPLPVKLLTNLPTFFIIFLFLFLFLLSIGCASVRVNSSEVVSSYAARASWQWQSIDHFLIRGRARLEGKNQLFSGPFLLWASKESAFVRADFSGPDGSVLLSFLLDSAGCLVYQPREAQAYYFIGGIPFGQGLLDVNAVISLVRTGFPIVLEQWKIVASADTSSIDEIRWAFFADESDSAFTVLQNTELFPSFVTDSFSVSVNSTSWHDSFNTWPMEWSLRSPAISAILRYRSIDTETEPDESVQYLQIPVAIDTIPSSFCFWTPTFHFPIR